MAQGLMSGVIWGVLVSGIGAGALSLAYPDFKPVLGSEASAVETGERVEAENVAQAKPQMEKPAQAAATQELEVTSKEEPVSDAEPTPAPEMKKQAEDEAEPASPDGSAAEAEPETQPEPSDAEPAEPEPQSDVPTQTETAAPEANEENQAAKPLVAPNGGTLGNLAEGVTTDRLPSLGNDVAKPNGPVPPYKRFAAPVEVDGDKPKMAIVLIDDGAGGLGVEALEAFPYPLTFAVDASSESAEAQMQAYRDKGFEVVALAALPDGAQPSDAEVALQSYLRAVPEAVAVMEAPGGGLQSSRELSDQVTRIVKDTGHGLVFQSKGLNTAQKLAFREGVPSASVFRDFDGKDQTSGVIKRFLDQAAFKAGQEGGVIMLGRLRAETISALLIWGLADRASRVALVPVSAVLAKSEGS